jgi:hypothetical protein
MSRKNAALLLVFGVVLLAAFVASLNAPAVSEAQITCGEQLATCPAVTATGTPGTPVPDNNVRSVAHITHHDQEGSARVEPNTGEDWIITAKYASEEGGEDCNCQTLEYTATVQVDWDAIPGSQEFIITNSSFSYPPFVGVDLNCGDDTCEEPFSGIATPTPSITKHGYGYSLAVNLDYTVWRECPIDGWTPFYLDQVLYTTTSVDNGHFLDSGCLYGGTAYPLTQTWQVGDNGAWTCSDDGCPNQIILDIKYDNTL